MLVSLSENQVSLLKKLKQTNLEESDQFDGRTMNALVAKGFVRKLKGEYKIKAAGIKALNGG